MQEYSRLSYIANLGKLGAWDAPDKRDFIADDRFLEKRSKIPIRVNLFEKSKLKAENQGSIGACTAFAITMVKQIQDSIEDGEPVQFDEWRQWDFQKTKGATDKGGDSLQNAVKMMRDHPPIEIGGFERPIKEYRVIRDEKEETMMRWLTQGFPVFTGVSVKQYNGKNNFGVSYKDGIVDIKNGYSVGGHAICICGFDQKKKVWKAVNSWSSAWGFYKNGTFDIPMEQLPYMMSRYLLFDLIDLSGVKKS